VDSIIVGANDLAGSLGRPGRTGDALVQEYLDKIADVAAKSPIALGLSTGYSGNVLGEWIERGLQWVSVGSDFSFMAQSASTTLQEVKSLLEKNSGQVNG
jgi:2-dehydro-3-deoxyglucarate aldolase/4-hydroxy-2-oxoheptanedioate aldolase